MVEEPPASSSAALLAAGGSSSFAQPLPRALLLQYKHHSLVPTTVGCTPNCLEDKDSETASSEWKLKEDAYVELPCSLRTPRAAEQNLLSLTTFMIKSPNHPMIL